MIINPATAIDNGWIKFPEYMSDQEIRECIQPNAIDFTLNRLFVPQTTTTAVTKKEKILPAYTEMQSLTRSELLSKLNTAFGIENVPSSGWILKADSVYDGMSDFFVKIPESVAATLIVRSTINRCGVQLAAGLYDQGFNNNIGFVLYTHNCPIMLEQGTRIGQIIFHEAISDGQLYNGSYNLSQNGQHWSSTMKGQ